MDYIREELLRQRAVLARLLLGRAEREEQNDAASMDTVRSDAEMLGEEDLFRASRSLAREERLPSGRRLARTAEGEAWGVYDGPGEKLPDSVPGYVWSRERAERRSNRFSDAEELTGVRYGLREGAALSGKREIGGFSAPTGPEERTVTETVWAAAEEAADARELSRVFQRDARRYDGGFTLY